MFLKNLWRLLTLKPHDEHLADGVVGTWLMLARPIIACVAFCEAIGWMYLGFITASGNLAYGVATVVGLIALIFIGSVDVLFVMHGTSQKRATTTEGDKSGRWAKWTSWTRRLQPSHGAIAARIVLVVLSFALTAPNFTLFFFA